LELRIFGSDGWDDKAEVNRSRREIKDDFTRNACDIASQRNLGSENTTVPDNLAFEERKFKDSGEHNIGVLLIVDLSVPCEIQNRSGTETTFRHYLPSFCVNFAKVSQNDVVLPYSWSLM
jgi:hypothetical protein